MRAMNSSDSNGNNEKQSLPLPPLSGTSELMGRLQSFLPQIKEANQALSQNTPPRVDLDLESDKDDDSSKEEEVFEKSDLEDNDDIVSKNMDGKNGAGSTQQGDKTPSNPTIQIEFAMGKIGDDPMMKLFETNDDKEDEENDKHSEIGHDMNPNKKRAIEGLLLQSSNLAEQEHTSSSHKKKALIQEM